MALPATFWQKFGTLAQMAQASVALLGFVAILFQVGEIRSNNRAVAARHDDAKLLGLRGEHLVLELGVRAGADEQRRADREPEHEHRREPLRAHAFHRRRR